MAPPSREWALAELRDSYADLELSDGELATMAWLEMWEARSIANLASVIKKARARGKRD